MGLNVNLEYSTLFSGLYSNRSASWNMEDFNLADFASIRNFSFFNFSTSYCSKNTVGKLFFSAPPLNKDSPKALSAIEIQAEQMKESADALISRRSKSLFSKKDFVTTAEDGSKTITNDYDRDVIYNGVREFIYDYNNLVLEAKGSSNINILRQTLSLTSYTNAYSNTLANTGISIGKDCKLSIDEEAFKESDMSTIKVLFNDANSYAYTVSAKASQIDYYAQSEANKTDTPFFHL